MEFFKKRKPQSEKSEPVDETAKLVLEREKLTPIVLREVRSFIDRQTNIAYQMGSTLNFAKQVGRGGIGDPVQKVLFGNYGDNNRAINTLLEMVHYQLNMSDPLISAQLFPGEVSKVDLRWQGVDGLEGLHRDDLVVVRQLPIRDIVSGGFVQRGLVTKIESKAGGDNREEIIAEVLKEVGERERG